MDNYYFGAEKRHGVEGALRCSPFRPERVCEERRSRVSPTFDYSRHLTRNSSPKSWIPGCCCDRATPDVLTGFTRNAAAGYQRFATHPGSKARIKVESESLARPRAKTLCRNSFSPASPRSRENAKEASVKRVVRYHMLFESCKLEEVGNVVNLSWLLVRLRLRTTNENPNLTSTAREQHMINPWTKHG